MTRRTTESPASEPATEDAEAAETALKIEANMEEKREESEANPLASLLTDPEEFGPETAAKETPQEVAYLVKRGYQLWQEKPRKWWAKRLPDEKEARRVRGLAKTCAQSQGLVFRVKNVTDKTLLVYRVTPKAQNESATGDGTDADNG